MRKGISFFTILLLMTTGSFGANNFMPKKFTTVTSHNDVYPYMLNNTKSSPKKTNASTINTNSAAPIGKRGVIKRTTHARAASVTNDNASERGVVQRKTNTISARTATTGNTNLRANKGRTTQNVVQRSTPVVRTRSAKSARVTTDSGEGKISSQRCFADYKACMELYCQREDTAYNRCYCSAKLSQIDAKYQNKIDSLIQQIVKLQYSNESATDEEIKEYWDQTVGSYTGTNPWVNIDNALNIEWADTQSRVNGQNAFNTGHEYCAQHLRGCYYMSSNMRDAYKSEIARDCEAYEKSLQKIQMAAESVIESYKD